MGQQTKIEQPKDNAYAYEDDLNYRDDGDATATPSYNDMYKGWQMDPYLPRQWASANKNRLTRTAVREVTQAPGDVNQLADYVLMLWQRVDGTLQDFFDGFTLRYPNTLKRELAKAIGERGYKVYPVITDDRVYYAQRVRGLLRQASANNVPAELKLRVCCAAFADSEGLQLCLGEVEDERELGTPLSDKGVRDLIDYYVLVFPRDYALALTRDYLDGEAIDVRAESFKDYNLSDESLQQMEKLLSGNQDPYYPVHDGGGGLGWDYVGDMRGDDGVRPERYELPHAASTNRLVKKNG
jgi:hypothetical protein